MCYQISPTWYHEQFTSSQLSTDRIIKNYCPWTQYRTAVINIHFLEPATELDPSSWRHCSPFKLQVVHVGYRETWKEKSVVDAYTKKCSLPNDALSGTVLKSFTSLDDTSVIWSTITHDIDIPYAVSKCPMAEDTCRYQSAHPYKCSQASMQQRQPLFSSLEF
jgi:hypothetical protein